jgi:hypothetical protein
MHTHIIMDNKSSYIKTDNGKFINEKFIIWVKKMDDCLNVGTVETSAVFNTYKICKLNNPHSYNKINDKIKDLVS